MAGRGSTRSVAEVGDDAQVIGGVDAPDRVGARQRAVDDVARAMSRNLFLPCRYLQIAMLYRREARPMESREWAERGLALFPEDEPLKRFLGHEPERDYTPEEDLGVMVAMRAAGC